MIGPRLRAGVVLLFVFSAGGLAGAAFDRHHHGPRPVVLSEAEQHEAAIAELRDVIGLDDQQMERVHAILAERQEVVQQMWEQLRPEVQSAMVDVHNEFAEVMRPEQRVLFEEWIQRRLDQSQGPHH